MLSKNEIKDIQSLSHKKGRNARQLFIAEGPKIVSELFALIPERIEKIYATPEWLQANANAAAKSVAVTSAELERISGLKTPNEVLAILSYFPNVVPATTGFTLYLDAIQDPGNLGTIIRTADWFGVKQVVCSPLCADVYNPKVIQSTMASIARVTVYYDEKDTWLSKQDRAIYAAVLGSRSMNEVKLQPDAVLMIGNESKGLSEEALRYATERISIPGRGGAESLNAAVATGILLSHLS